MRLSNRCGHRHERAFGNEHISGARSTWVIGSIAVALFWSVASARASADTPDVLVIAPSAKSGSSEAEIIEAVRDALADFDEVKLLPPPPLDLEAVQLALDCDDESAECLGEIATRMQADVVVVPSLAARRDALELRVTCFRRGADQPLTVAMRKQVGARLDRTLLDAVPAMLREALQLDAEPSDEAELPAADAAPIEPIAAPEPLEEEPEHTASSGRSIGPWLVGGGGLALIASGIVAGALARSTEDEYAAHDVNTKAEAEEADALRVRGKNEATIANVLIGTGAAALIGAGIWYWLDGRSESEPASARVQPLLGDGTTGLLVTGTFGARP